MTTGIAAPPSVNPADENTLIGVLRLFLTKTQQNWDDMLPARVVAYDAASNTARVQPMIAMVTTDDVIVQRAQVAAVPVFQVGAGGFVLRFPVAAGDLGWIKASDRDISLFLQSKEASPPNTMRMHCFSDAVFFPDAMLKGATIAPEDAGNAVWQTLDGSVKVALASESIRMAAPKGVGIGGAPNEHAILDLQSTTQAFLPPRMNTGQRDAIAAAQGMMIYNTDIPGIQTYDGTAWS
jgi:hypothetical protein